MNLHKTTEKINSNDYFLDKKNKVDGHGVKVRLLSVYCLILFRFLNHMTVCITYQIK